jgi:hypothetical protein
MLSNSTRPGIASHQPVLDWIGAEDKDDRNRRGHLLDCPGRGGAICDDEVHPALHQLGRKGGEPLPCLRVVGLKEEIVANDVPERAQFLQEVNRPRSDNPRFGKHCQLGFAQPQFAAENLGVVLADERRAPGNAPGRLTVQCSGTGIDEAPAQLGM